MEKKIKLLGDIEVTEKQAEWLDEKLYGKPFQWEHEGRIIVRRWKAKKIIKELRKRGFEPMIFYRWLDAIITYKLISAGNQKERKS